MRVLVACEESQTVCKAFRVKGHEAYSCDIIDCSGGHPEWHIHDDVLKHLGGLKCWKCDGNGKVYKYTSSTPEGMQSGNCPVCGGVGLLQWDL